MMAKKITAWKSTNGIIYETQKEAEQVERRDKAEKALEELVRNYIEDTNNLRLDDVDEIVCLIIDNRHKINQIFGD